MLFSPTSCFIFYLPSCSSGKVNPGNSPSRWNFTRSSLLMLNFNDCTFITMCKHIKMSKLFWYQSMGANRNLYRWANNILNEIATGLTWHAIECTNICDMNILFVFQLFFSQFIFELNRCPLPWWHHATLESFHSWDPLPLSLNLKSIFHFLGALQNPSGRYYEWHTQQLLQHTSSRVMTKATHTHTHILSRH